MMIERQFQILRMLKKASGHTRPTPGAPRRTSSPGEAAGSKNPEAYNCGTLRGMRDRERSWGIFQHP